MSVKYFSKGYKNLKVLYKPTREQLVTDGVTGTQTRWVEPSEIIAFDGYVYETSNPEIIKFLDNHSAFTGVTPTGKTAKIMFERAMPRDVVQEEFLAMVQEYGRENVVQMLRDRKKADTPESLLEEAQKAIRKAARKVAKAEKSGDPEEMRIALEYKQRAERKMLKAEKSVTQSERKSVGG